MIIFNGVRNRVNWSRYATIDTGIRPSPELEAVISTADLMGWEVDLGGEITNGLEQIKQLTHDEWGVRIYFNQIGETVVENTIGPLAGFTLARAYHLRAHHLIIFLVAAKKAVESFRATVPEGTDMDYFYGSELGMAVDRERDNTILLKIPELFAL